MLEEGLLERIQNAINYVEDHIYAKIQIKDIAKASFMSQSAFYTIFSNALGTTIKDYIRKRRLSLSAHDLVRSDLSILDIALKYQYATCESYSRAFKKLFGVPPQKYRENSQYIDVFPKFILTYKYFSEGNYIINREMNTTAVIQNIDNHTNGYLLDIDIDNFLRINTNYGYSTGDKILIEVPNRIQTVLNNHKIETNVIRVNNDEFVIIIKDKPKTFIEELSKEIINIISNPFVFDELWINLTVSIGISSFSAPNNNEKAIKTANSAMLLAKANGKNQYTQLEEVTYDNEPY